MDQELCAAAQMHREKAQAFFKPCLNPTILMLRSSPLKFPPLDPKKVQNSPDVSWTAGPRRKPGMPFLPAGDVSRIWAGGPQPFPPSPADAWCLLSDLPALAFRRWKSAHPLIACLPSTSTTISRVKLLPAVTFPAPQPGVQKKGQMQARAQSDQKGVRIYNWEVLRLQRCSLS